MACAMWRSQMQLQLQYMLMCSLLVMQYKFEIYAQMLFKG
jgi:hypothetical protein